MAYGKREGLTIPGSSLCRSETGRTGGGEAFEDEDLTANQAESRGLSRLDITSHPRATVSQILRARVTAW